MKKQIEDLQSDDMSFEANIKKILGSTFPLPEKVEHAKQEAFEKVRAIAQEKEEKEELMDSMDKTVNITKRKDKQKIRKLYFGGFAAAAVAAAVIISIWMISPTVTARVPIVEHVFQEMGGILEFAGDYTELAQPVKQAETGIESITANGTTVTLSEVYCNETALSLSLVIHSEEKIPDTCVHENGKPEIDFGGLVDFDFDNEEGIDWAYAGDPSIDGALVDDNTFAGVIRFEMGQYFAYAGLETEIPEKFQVKLSISQIYGTKLEDSRPPMPKELREEYEAAMEKNGLGLTDEDYEKFTEEQKEIEHQLFNDMWNAYYEQYPDRQKYPNQYDNWFLEGPWDFEFEVSRNNENVIRKEINDVDENGLGILAVTKTPMEIAVDMEENLDYAVVILDAKGSLMGGDAVVFQNKVPVNGFDTSKIDIYICDYIEYMDELKGYWWSDKYDESVKGEIFKELMDQRSLYHREIIFDE